MKNILIVFGIGLLLLACTGQKGRATAAADANEVTLHEGEWVYNFKNEVYFACLRKLHPQGMKAIDSFDGSTSANLDQLGFNPVVGRTIDSLSREFAKQSSNSIKLDGRPIWFNLCLAYRNSVELDGIALRLQKDLDPDRR